MLQPAYSLLLLAGYALYEFLLKRYYFPASTLTPRHYTMLALCRAVFVLRYLSVVACVDIALMSIGNFGITKYGEKKNIHENPTIEYYLVKQGVMVGLTIFVPLWHTAVPSAEWFNNLYKTLIGDTEIPVNKYAMLLISYTFVIDGGTRIVRGVLNKFPNLKRYALLVIEEKREEKLKRKKEKEGKESAQASKMEEEKAGELIGIIERLLILTFVIAQNYEAVAFAVAAKSIARYSLLDDKDFAKYYLLGTSLSVVVAVFTALMIVTIAF